MFYLHHYLIPFHFSFFPQQASFLQQMPFLHYLMSYSIKRYQSLPNHPFHQEYQLLPDQLCLSSDNLFKPLQESFPTTSEFLVFSFC
jgi:hypothetical protein